MVLLVLTALLMLVGVQSALAATLNVPADYPTIQAAVSDAAAMGDVIKIAAGTYTETGQIVIDKSLSIVGAGKTATVIKTASDTTGSDPGRSWFLVNAGKTVNFKDLTLDGSGHTVAQAIGDKGNGTIENVKFTNIRFAKYVGAGVRIYGPGNVNVKNCEFTSMERNGVIIGVGGLSGATGTFTGNTFVGDGPGDRLNYAFEVVYGALAVIANNQVSNCGPSTSGWGSSAISVWDDPGTGATITGNTLTDNECGVAIAMASGASDPVVTIGAGNVITGSATAGIDIQDAGAPGSPAVTVSLTTITDGVDGIYVAAGNSTVNMAVHASSFSNNSGYDINNAGTGSINATNNFWGAAGGPPAVVNAASGPVAYTPWISAPTTVSSPASSNWSIAALLLAGVAGTAWFARKQSLLAT